MQGYTEKILKYAANETHIGLLENADGTGEVGLTDQQVGKQLAVRFTLNTDRDRIKDIRFQVFGCGFTIAACAAAAELSEGRALQEILNYTPATIDNALDGLPAERSYCAELATQALQAAITSAQQGSTPVQAAPPAAEEDDPQLSADDPLYRSLLATSAPLGSNELDRQLFAGLLAVAANESGRAEISLGLAPEEVEQICAEYFPGFDYLMLMQGAPRVAPPEINPEILAILQAHRPCDVTGGLHRSSDWLAKIIAARATKPGHLWCAMGCMQRPELTAAIKRHLPTLAAANNLGMRWKRYLFKQVCELNGGMLCKTPNCGDCSDYALCFAPENN